MRRSPIRSTAAARRSSSGPCGPRPTVSAGRTAGRGAGCSGRSCAMRRSSVRSSCGRSSTCRDIRWRSRGSACRRCARHAGLARARFDDEAARALFAGIAAHSMLRLDRPLSASFGLVLATYAHAVGWPMVRGGAAARGRGARRGARGGRRRARDRSPGRLARGAAAGTCRPARRHAAPARSRSPATGCRRGPAARAERFRYGPGVFKVDWALDGPVPWAADGPRRAATVHLGGTLDEIAAGEAEVAAGRHPGAARTCCSSSTRRGTRRGRPPARRRPGRTATSRPARRST